MNAAAISMSGMNAARLGLDASAHNVANAQTPGFRPHKVVMRTQSDGGVAAQVKTASEPGVNLEAEAAAQFELVYIFKANVCVVEVQNSLTGSLLNAKA